MNFIDLPGIKHWSLKIVEKSFSASELRSAIAYLYDVLDGTRRPGNEFYQLGISPHSYSREEVYAVLHRVQYALAKKEKYDHEEKRTA